MFNFNINMISFSVCLSTHLSYQHLSHRHVCYFQDTHRGAITAELKIRLLIYKNV